MTRRAALALALLLAAPRAWADETRGPRLAIEPAGFDFGRALQWRVLRKAFRLRNLGDQELLIQKVSTYCGCAAALLSDAERRLAPGGAATLEVVIETRDDLGRVSRSVRLVTNDSRRATHELKLTADVRATRRR